MNVDANARGALSSGAFRFALVLAAVFALGSALLLWSVQRQIDDYASDATRAMLRSEATALSGEYAAEGLSPVAAAIAEREKAPGSPWHYALIDGRGRQIAGTLPASAARLGWSRGIEAERGDSHASMQHYGLALPSGGGVLVVATDTFDIDETRTRLEGFTLACAVGITLFALVGGGLAGRAFLGRLDRINRTVDRIIDGHRGERVPHIGVGPEFDRLTDQLNRMLDRNDAAIEGLKQVSTAIAHDLRTPLGRLRQHLEDMILDGTTRPEALEQALAQTDDILALFQDLLRIGMMEGGAGRARFAPMALDRIVAQVAEAYGPVVEDSGRELVLGTLPAVALMGDAALIPQLLANLIENAIAHTPPGTRIDLGLRVAAESCILSVADNGPGVSDADAPHLFERFFRSDASRGTPGAGLGLALVAAIAELHGAHPHITRTIGGLAIEIAFPTVTDAAAISARAEPAVAE